jgi:hypothetical protein
MIHRRIVPNLNVDDATTGHDFYEDFLGLRKEFDMGWIASFRSPTKRRCPPAAILRRNPDLGRSAP